MTFNEAEEHYRTIVELTNSGTSWNDPHVVKLSIELAGFVGYHVSILGLIFLAAAAISFLLARRIRLRSPKYPYRSTRLSIPEAVWLVLAAGFLAFSAINLVEAYITLTHPVEWAKRLVETIAEKGYYTF